MNNSEYPNLKHFFSCYFNQDWDFEYATWEEAVERYVSDVILLHLNQTIIEFGMFIKCNLAEKKLNRELGRLGCDIEPPGSADGLLYKEWIVLLRNELVRLRDLKDSE
tara:strand:- start:62908 stop:63231 length:324 start_codon:yes stop_codon:yes gene_type:complete